MTNYIFTKDFPPTNHKKGDRLQNDGLDFPYSQSEIATWLALGIIEEETIKPVEEWPKNEDMYFFIGSEGETFRSDWDGCGRDEDRKSFLGTYKTKEEAESARDAIRTFAQKLSNPSTS